MPAIITRIRIVITALLPYAVALSAALVVVEGQLGELGGVPAVVTQWVARVATVLASAIAVMRRVTPVIPADRGLLPPDRPADPNVTAANADVGQIGLGLLFRIVALVLFLIVAAIGATWINSQYIFAFLGFGLAAWVLAELVP